MLRVLDLTDNDRDSDQLGWNVNIGKSPDGSTPTYWVGINGFENSQFKINIDPEHFLDITLPGSIHPTAPVTFIARDDADGEDVLYLTSADEHTDRTVVAFNVETRSIEAITAVTITNGYVVGFELADEGFSHRLTLVLVDIDRTQPLSFEYEYGFPGSFFVAKRKVVYPPASKPRLNMDITKATQTYEQPLVKLAPADFMAELIDKGIYLGSATKLAQALTPVPTEE
jgi:hypothetical protein